MKKARRILGYVNFGLIIMLPFSEIMGCICSYRIVPFSYVALAVVTAFFASLCAVLCRTDDDVSLGSLSDVVLILSFPMSVISSIIYLSRSCEIYILIPLLALIIAAGYTALNTDRLRVLRITASVISVILIICFLIFSLLFALFAGLGSYSLAKEIASPDGRYVLEIFDHDQGALGGDTYYMVRRSALIDLGILRIEGTSEKIHTGEWQEYKRDDIYWVDDETVSILGEEISIYN